jgi:hypothetical protein
MSYERRSRSVGRWRKCPVVSAFEPGAARTRRCDATFPDWTSTTPTCQPLSTAAFVHPDRGRRRPANGGSRQHFDSRRSPVTRIRAERRDASLHQRPDPSIGAQYRSLHRAGMGKGTTGCRGLQATAAQRGPRREPPYSSGRLRLRLVRDGLKEPRCELCGIDTWQGRPLLLALDHINGDPSDNRLVNLRIVCPNCHALTETWCARNRKPAYSNRQRGQI